MIPFVPGNYRRCKNNSEELKSNLLGGEDPAITIGIGLTSKDQNIKCPAKLAGRSCIGYLNNLLQ